jgi:hypothetical protein
LTFALIGYGTEPGRRLKRAANYGIGNNKEPLLGSERKKLNTDIMTLLRNIQTKIHIISTKEKKIGTNEDTSTFRHEMQTINAAPPKSKPQQPCSKTPRDRSSSLCSSKGTILMYSAKEGGKEAEGTQKLIHY